MVVVDCIERCAVQTETVLHCTARDSIFVRGQGGSVYPRISDDTWRHVQSTPERNKNVNVITATHNDAPLHDAKVGLERSSCIWEWSSRMVLQCRAFCQDLRFKGGRREDTFS